jgi:zinc D-Ala-D-Ala dipeptidase
MSLEPGFSFLDDLLAGVRWDAKYATWDNFTGTPVDGYVANRIVVSDALGRALGVAIGRAERLGLGLLVWDGYRPQRAVDHFVRWAAEPEDGRTKRWFHPRIDRAEMITGGYVAPRSAHSRGAAIDLTLYRLDDGALLAMGGRHDLMDERSHHACAGLPSTVARNRSALCELMESSGFQHHPCEWWHYSLTNEPFPDTYFDFPVG